jgi:cob(I)alamin adenosyltransferase
MNEETQKAQRHKARMEKKKAVVDAQIQKADGERGVVIVNTGNGKGKSSSGFGVVARALGHGMRIGVIQFIKGRGTTGEEAFFRRFPEVDYHVMGDGFTWETQNRDQDIATARRAWDQALAMLGDDGYDLILLDELNIVLKYHYLPVGEVIAALQQRPPMQHVVITGRGAPQALIDVADTVTRMDEVKHAYKDGIKAQKGLEF